MQIESYLLKNRTTVNEEIQPCANFIEENTIPLSKELLLLKKIIITTLITSTRYDDMLFYFLVCVHIILDMQTKLKFYF